MTFAGIKAYFENIHWPQAFFLSIFLVCIFGAPVLFFALVKAEILVILVELPWLTILGPGLVAFLGALSAIAGFFGHPIIRKTLVVDSKTDEVVSSHTTTTAERDDTHEVG